MLPARELYRVSNAPYSVYLFLHDRLVLQTHWDTQGARVTFEVRAGTRGGETVPTRAVGPDLRATQPARRIIASKLMKHSAFVIPSGP
jgi:hypothetical protein